MWMNNLIYPSFCQNKELQRGNTIEDSQIFLDSRGCLEAATHVSSNSLINLVACHHVSNLTQTTLDQYV